MQFQLVRRFRLSQISQSIFRILIGYLKVGKKNQFHFERTVNGDDLEPPTVIVECLRDAREKIPFYLEGERGRKEIVIGGGGGVGGGGEEEGGEEEEEEEEE